MPIPHAGEQKDDFIARCISYVRENEGKGSEQAAGICFGIWDSHQERMQEASRLTDAERFKRKMMQLVKQQEKLPRQAVKRVLSILTELQQSIFNEIAKQPQTQWNAVFLDNILAQLDNSFAAWESSLMIEFHDIIEDTWNAGGNAIDESFYRTRAAQVIPLLSPDLGREELEILQGFNAELVTNISSEVKTKITSQIRMAILGRQTANETMINIGTVISDKGVFKSIASRAAVITDTEVMRVLNLAKQRRSEQLEEGGAPLGKFWIHSDNINARPAHVAAETDTRPDMGGTPIPVDAMFSINGIECYGPHDPRLPAKETISCGCTLGYAFLE